MDLSVFIVVAVGILFFVGGTALVEVRSRKGKSPGGRGEATLPGAATPTAYPGPNAKGRGLWGETVSAKGSGHGV